MIQDINNVIVYDNLIFVEYINKINWSLKNVITSGEAAMHAINENRFKNENLLL